MWPPRACCVRVVSVRAFLLLFLGCTDTVCSHGARSHCASLTEPTAAVHRVQLWASVFSLLAQLCRIDALLHERLRRACRVAQNSSCCCRSVRTVPDGLDAALWPHSHGARLACQCWTVRDSVWVRLRTVSRCSCPPTERIVGRACDVQRKAVRRVRRRFRCGDFGRFL